MNDQSQPIYIEGYHRPSYHDPDDVVYDMLASLLASGRTSRLYKSLVRDKKIALAAQGFANFPGVKYPQLFGFFAANNPGHTPQELADAIHQEIDRLKNEDVRDKFLANATLHFSEAQAHAVCESVLALDRAESIATLDGLLGQAP